MDVKTNLEAINQKIIEACKRSNRDRESVKVIAVTKYVSVERAEEAVQAGVAHLGENRDEGLMEKWESLKESCNWHFIGTLQSRKVKNVIDKVTYIHSLDRVSLAKEIDKRVNGEKMKCFVQVNASLEDSKHGLLAEQVIPFIKKLEEFPNIEIVGLMTMAPLTDDKEEIRSTFKKVKQLQLEVQALQLEYAPCEELSMGMSNDYEIAIEEGSTFIRIGTALVG